MNLNKLQNLDPRYIYILLILATAGPMILPLGIPLSTSSGNVKFYEIMDAIEPGDKVLFSLDYSVGGGPDVHPQAVALMKHMMDRGIGVAMISFWNVGPMFGEQLIQPYEDAGYEYGVHFANLGYIPGGETAIKRFGEDVLGAVSKDFRKNDVKGLPIMAGIKDTRDFAAVICFASGNPGIDEWVRQVQGPLNINFLAATVTVSAPQAMPFVNAGQVKALLIGLRGAAEYELLMSEPGPSVAKMDAQSLGHIIVIAFIVLGNIAFVMEKRRSA